MGKKPIVNYCFSATANEIDTKKCHIAHTTGIFWWISFSGVFQNNFTSNLKNLLQYREEQKSLKRTVERENQRLRFSPQSVELAKPYWSTAEDIKGKKSDGERQRGSPTQ